MAAAQRLRDLPRQLLLADQPRPDRVADVVVDVGDGVGQLHDLALQRRRGAVALGQDVLSHLGAVDDGVAHLPGQVQSLQLLDHPQALLRVPEPFR